MVPHRCGVISTLDFAGLLLHPGQPFVLLTFFFFWPGALAIRLCAAARAAIEPLLVAAWRLPDMIGTPFIEAFLACHWSTSLLQSSLARLRGSCNVCFLSRKRFA